MTYYTAEQFVQLTNEIVEGIYTDLQVQDPGWYTETYIFIITKHKGEEFNYRDNELVGLEIGDEKPVVYKTTHRSGNFTFNHVNVIFDVKNTVYQSKPILEFNRDNFEFTSYEDFLKFYTEVYRDAVKDYKGKVTIQTTIQGTRFNVPSFLMDKLTKAGMVNDLTKSGFGKSSLSNLEDYQEVPSAIKEKIDGWLGTFTAHPWNVNASRFLGNVEITKELEHLLKENCQTDKWDDKIQNVLKTEPIDLSVTSDE